MKIKPLSKMTNPNQTIFAHTNGREQSNWQTLEEHLNTVSTCAGQFAAAFDSENWAKAAGSLHDLGKILEGFQKKLRISNGLDYEYENENVSGISNHSNAGAAYAEERYKIFGRALAYIIAGHHTGLPDYYSEKTAGKSLSARMNNAKKELDEIRNKISGYVQNLPELKQLPKFVTPDNFHLWVRMLFSCLIDADWLDTETACDAEKSQKRTENRFPSLAELKQKFDSKLQTKIETAERNELNAIRKQILEQCRETGKKHNNGLFTLAVPTGGGKTLSSMAFALEHAIKHGKSRIIYVIPYTSIIEQTADEFRKYFGTENVVEHHSNIDAKKLDTQKNSAENAPYGQEKADIAARMEMAAENWDAPIIVTTNVQFFESLYSAQPRRCRKLHNIVNSVVILDEAQLISPEYLSPCIEVLNQLSKNFNTSIVFCTATQPKPKSLDNVMDIIPSDLQHEHYKKLKRTDIQFPKDLNERISFEALAAELLQYEKVLCIVNTRTDCRTLFKLMPEGTVHLSALMCGEHRSKVIADIKARLKEDQPLRVISTQLVEAGVDIDFPVVYRALAGLDSIVQAAGRCNREGKLNGYGLVRIFVPEKSAPKGLLLKGENTTKELFDTEMIEQDNPEMFAKYFGIFYDKLPDIGENILNDLKLGLKDGSVNFRSVGESFRLIDDDYAVPIIVRYGGSSALVERLKNEGIHKEIMRSLQRYTVNIPRNNANELLKSGMLQRIVIHGKESEIFVQYNDSCYSEKFGADMQKKELSAGESIVSNKSLVEFIVFAIADFANEKQLAIKDAFLYLHKYKGIAYLQEFYEIEHTLPPDMTIEALTKICRQNGGDLS